MLVLVRASSAARRLHRLPVVARREVLLGPQARGGLDLGDQDVLGLAGGDQVGLVHPCGVVVDGGPCGDANSMPTA